MIESRCVLMCYCAIELLFCCRLRDVTTRPHRTPPLVKLEKYSNENTQIIIIIIIIKIIIIYFLATTVNVHCVIVLSRGKYIMI